MKTSVLKLLSILVLLALARCAKSPGAKCMVDADCADDHLRCLNQVCQHKKLFPMLTSEIVGLCIMVFLVMFAILFGLGGGVLIVPLAILVLGFSPREAVVMSNCIVAMTSMTKYLMGLAKHNPRVSFKTIVDYNAVIAMAPPLVMSSTLGAMLAPILPDIIILGLMMAAMLYSSVSTIFQIMRQKKKDQSVKGSMVSDATITAENRVSLIADKENGEEIEVQKRIEGNNFYFPKFIVLLAVIAISLLLGLFRGGQGFDSIVGIKKCSTEDWIVVAVYTLSLIAITFYSTVLIFQEQRHKQMIGWNLDPEEVHFTRKTFAATLTWSYITGILSTVTGLGAGTLLNPFFWWLKFQPVTASWTININSLLSKLAAVIIILLSGQMIWDYVLVFGGLIAVAIMISENLLLGIIKKTKSQVIMPIGLFSVLVVCISITCLNTYFNLQEKQEKGLSIWRFGKYC